MTESPAKQEARLAPETAETTSETYDLSLLEQSMRKWRRSAALRVAYRDIHRTMAAQAPDGPCLEIGSGIGVLRETVPGVLTTDIRKTPYVDAAASAYALDRVPGGPWAAVYMMDVLHHLQRPFAFFESAAGVLKTGGRIIMCEPAATVCGRLFYRLFHHEPIVPAAINAPYDFREDKYGGEFANMAMAWCLFERDRSAVACRLRALRLKIHKIAYRDLLGYPMTGGFSKPSLLPPKVVERLLAWEASLPASIMKVLGLRMLIVIERTP